MSWATLLDLIADELGSDAAARVEKRARLEMGGLRISISTREVITMRKVNEVAPGKPREAARKLRVHPETVYRLMRRQIIR